MSTRYDPATSAVMGSIARTTVIAVTIAIFLAAMLSAALGHRDIAVVLALAAPLGISAWGFVRAGHNEAALGLLSCVLLTAITLVLVLNPLGVHHMAVMAYAGIVLLASMLFSRRLFLSITGLTVLAATAAFVYDLGGHSRSVVALHSGWPHYVVFVLVLVVVGFLGRTVAEKLFGSLGEAHAAAQSDAITGLQNRPGFMAAAAKRLRASHERGEGAVLVVADLDDFRRANLVVGHQAADNLLVEGARRLMTECAGDLVARIGDDEFAVLRVGMHEAHAAEFARVVSKALTFEHLGVEVRNSAGYARFPRDASDIDTLLMAAENGVTAAKAGESERVVGPADRI